MLQVKQIESIKGVLANTKAELLSTLNENLETSNVKSATTIIEDISTINKIMELVGVKHAKTTKSEKTATSKKEKTTRASTKNQFGLGDDLKGKRPASVKIFGEAHAVTSFRDLSREICESSFTHNPAAFLNLENIPDVNGAEHPYFSNKSDKNMGEAVQLVAKSGEKCYVDVSKLAMNNLLFIRKMLHELGIDEKSIKITIDPQYRRKPRTPKKVAES